MDDTVVTQVTFEIGQIDHLLMVYDDLLARSLQTPPDLIELTAIASVLHSFYNGLENIFLVIAKRLDQHVPAGPQSHRDLLVQMIQPTTTRGSVISPELAQQLAMYLSFRHFYRHAYSYFLQWSELEKLVAPLQEFWARVKRDLYAFLDGLSLCQSDEQRN